MDFVSAIPKKNATAEFIGQGMFNFRKRFRTPRNLLSDIKKMLMFLLLNVTSLMQSMDQNVIKAVKLHYRKILLKRIAASEVLKKFNLKDVIKSANVWQHPKVMV